MADTTEVEGQSQAAPAAANLPATTEPTKGEIVPREGSELVPGDKENTWRLRDLVVSPLGKEGSSSEFYMKFPTIIGKGDNKKERKEKPLKTRGEQQAHLLKKYQQQPGTAATVYTMPSVCRLIPHIIMFENMYDVEFIEIFGVRLGTSAKEKEELRKQRALLQKFLRWEWGSVIGERPSATLDRLHDALMSMTPADRGKWELKFNKLADYLLEIGWKDGEPVGAPLDLPNKVLIIETKADEFPAKEDSKSASESEKTDVSNAEVVSGQAQIAAD